MKSLKVKLIVLLIATFAIAMLIPFNVLAANEGVQLIKTTDGNIVIYVEGLEKTAFDYALSENANAEDKDLNYIKSVQDSNEDEANQVALIMAEDYVETQNDLYIKTEEGVAISDDRAKVIEAYGENFEENGNKITYTKGNVELSFLIENDIVTSIEYVLVVE